MIRLVDVFAGRGGLGEGFSRYVDSAGRHRFQIAVSMEKDSVAHQTLRLRAFRRQFDLEPAAYVQFIKGEIDWPSLATAYPRQADLASDEAHCIELGPENVARVRKLIDAHIEKDSEWALIGGPPCQAYSLVGRSRNSKNRNYRPEEDKRQTLYVEYLQILGDHAPPVFVMENVKGLLSAELQQTRMFDLIVRDLADPPAALKREGRKARVGKVRYQIRPVVQPLDLFAMKPGSYVVRSEDFGIPQRRHRVILLGVREDISGGSVSYLKTLREVKASAVLDKMPRLRSGLSKESDSSSAWLDVIKAMRRASWMSELDADVRAVIREVIDGMNVPRAGRGRDYLEHGEEVILNHATRGHIAADLGRYMFASAYASARAQSPRLRDFPASLLPKHENVEKALGHGLFSDRFRVQLRKSPSTTITSHISKDGHYYIHPDPSQCRSLTVREAAGLQTFPEDYFFCGPRTAQYLQVGNAVPPDLAMQIAGIVSELF